MISNKTYSSVSCIDMIEMLSSGALCLFLSEKEEYCCGEHDEQRNNQSSVICLFIFVAWAEIYHSICGFTIFVNYWHDVFVNIKRRERGRDKIVNFILSK